ncbi:MAG: T9SS type A sorting domain-containing protein [Candidatus Eisenbacteria bacterium]|nr:T9SS type A sorting domain-containing protein [Candidatus Eisenbacteria bacterium]
MRFVLALCAVAPACVSPSRGASLAADRCDATREELLARFRPALYLEDDGPDGRRRDWPSRYDDDPDIENNFEMPPGAASAIGYGQVVEARDANGKACLVLEYHFYYPRNWTGGNGIGCDTHEHDWEWIYVVAGWKDERSLPYCACFSGHFAGNRETFETPGAVRLFPGIYGGSVWRDSWSRQPDAAARVSLLEDEHLEATALAAGNAFDGAPEQPRNGPLFDLYALLDPTGYGSGCGEASAFCYGDPALDWYCVGRSARRECVDERMPPWLRDGLGENDPLPPDFRLPEDWDENASTFPAATRTTLSIHVRPNPASARVDLFFGPSRPVSIDLLDAAGRRLRSIAAVGESGTVALDLDRLPSGIYWVRVFWQAGSREEARRVVVVR